MKREFRAVSVGHVGTRRPQPRPTSLPAIKGSQSTTCQILRQVMVDALKQRNAAQPTKGPMGVPIPAPSPAPSAPAKHPGFAAPAPSLIDRLKGRK